MIVVCCTDRRFAQAAGVMLASLFANGGTGVWRIVVIGYRLRPVDKKKLRASSGPDGERLEFIDVDPRAPVLRGLLPTRIALSPAPYLRLLIPDLLNTETGRVIYLDADTLVLSSLRPLAELDLEGCLLAAAPDAAGNHPGVARGLPLSADKPNFNSGVLLVDLDRWRDADMTRRAFRFIEEHEDRISAADQDVLNCLLDGKWKLLGQEWNYFNVEYQAPPGGYGQVNIVHFVGAKPWLSECGNPAREIYLQYRALTPWRDKRLTSRFERRAGKIIGKRVGRFRTWWIMCGR
jgi:lipopolysaccharide biosynthesis glycosyltransferase